MKGEPIYFADAGEFRRWLSAHAMKEVEVEVGFVKKRAGSPALTWPLAVDEALCFGWIDGVRRKVDEKRYRIRFTPRKAGSTWSAVNIRRFGVLQAERRVTPAGLAAFEKRTEAKSRIYSYEQKEAPEFSAGETKAFKRNKAAWAFIEASAPSYRKRVTWWVVSAKQEATRAKRFAILVEACGEGRKL